MDRTDVLWERLGALSGILFAVLLVAGMSLGGDESHNPSQPAAVLASRIADERDRVRLGVYLALLGVLHDHEFGRGMVRRFTARQH